MLVLKNVSKVYQDKKEISTQALFDITLSFPSTGMIFLLGKSGSGKSTLLHILGAIDSPTKGNVSLDGVDLFQKMDLDVYRNTVVGFVFQDYNLLEDYNVYENMELAVKLQQGSVSKEKLDEVLQRFGLVGLGKRKINALSGGQKQRVAIARAMIKNPSIILADEPTGNLDSSSASIVFDSLKEISREKLVIVVSHDEEAALRYGDRVITLADGKVVQDVGKKEEKSFPIISHKNPYLPFSYAFHMAVRNIFTKPLKLVLTILLLTISLVFATLALNCHLFSEPLLVENTMKANQNPIYTLEHVELTKNVFGGYQYHYKINSYKLEYFEHLSSSILNPVYELYDEGERLSFQWGDTSSANAFLEEMPSLFKIVEIKDDRLVEHRIGNIPKNPNEIMVHKYFADYIIANGIIDSNNEVYFPQTYQDIVSERHPISLGRNAVVIVGILDDDTSLYEESFQKNKFQSRELSDYYREDYVKKAHTIYVKGFTSEAILSNPKEVLLRHMNMQIDQLYSSEVQGINSSLSIYNDSGKILIDSLEKEEVIVSIDEMAKVSSRFQEIYKSYLIQKNEEEFINRIKQYFKEETSERACVLSFQNNGESIIYFPKIVGISLDSIYISEAILEEFIPLEKELTSLMVYETDSVALQQMFRNVELQQLSQWDDDFRLQYDLASTPYIQGTMSVAGLYEVLEKYIFILTLVFLGFTICLFLNFLYTNIAYAKKEIGILKSLGARSRDVTKIFLLESMIVSILSYCFSMVAFFFVMQRINLAYAYSYFYQIHVVVFHPLIPITMFVFTLLVAFLIPILSLDRIYKIQPIEAILNQN